MNKSYDENNIFAKILRAEVPCHKILENDHALAFSDINPQSVIHVLVVPKKAYLNFYDFTENASCLLYTSPSPRDGLLSRMPSSA